MSASPGSWRPSTASRGRSNAVHDARAGFLDSLAVLAGCTESFGPTLPDGRRPDVLRYDSHRRILFIGDAKEAETAGDLEAQVRLNRYLHWAAANVRAGGTTVVAICCPEAHARPWSGVLEMLADEARLGPAARGQEDFGEDLAVVWLAAPPGGAEVWRPRGYADPDTADGPATGVTPSSSR